MKLRFFNIEAWFTAEAATPKAAVGTYGSISATTSATDLDGLTFEFNVTPQTNHKVKLHDGAGNTKWYSPDGNKLNSRAIELSELGDFYSYADITIAGVYNTTAYDAWITGGKTGTKPTVISASDLEKYADDYEFKVSPVTTAATDRGRISAAEPVAVSDLASMATTALEFTVTINGSGAANITSGPNSSTAGRFYVSVLGNDSVKNGGENASFIIEKK